jgi:hypothetical protein
MSDLFGHNLARFEARLEHLIEGTFTGLFRSALRPQDIALQLARAVEAQLLNTADDPRPLAPDLFAIQLGSDAYQAWNALPGDMPQRLSEYLIELAINSGYRLRERPQITVRENASLAPTAFRVVASHMQRSRKSTGILERVTLPESQMPPPNAQLVIGGVRTELLTEPLITIGRSRENDIVIHDPHVSRHHVQLRLRFGHYTLFDVESQSGTTVNDTPVREHILQTGDVVCIGKTRMVYLADDDVEDDPTLPQHPV